VRALAVNKSKTRVDREYRSTRVLYFLLFTTVSVGTDVKVYDDTNNNNNNNNDDDDDDDDARPKEIVYGTR